MVIDRMFRPDLIAKMLSNQCIDEALYCPLLREKYCPFTKISCKKVTPEDWMTQFDYEGGNDGIHSDRTA